MQNDNNSQSHEKTKKTQGKLKRFLLKNGMTMALIGSLVTYFAVQKYNVPHVVKESIYRSIKEKEIISELKRNSLFKDKLPKKKDYMYVEIPNSVAFSHLEGMDVGDYLEKRGLYEGARIAVSIFETERMQKVPDKKRMKLVESEFPEIKKCETYQDIAYELYKKKEAVGLKTKPTDAVKAYDYILKAQSTKSKKTYEKYLYKAMLIAPELVTMSNHTDELRGMLKVILSNDNHVVIMPGVKENPINKRTSFNNHRTDQILNRQREGRV